MTWIQIIQWVLLVWLVSFFIRSILEIFNLDKLDNIVTGILFVSAGLIWIAAMYWKLDVQQIFYPFFIQSTIGLLLASYGVKMIWKKPIGSIVACVLIVLVSGFLYYNAPSHTENEYSFLSRYFPFLSSQIISDGMVDKNKDTAKESGTVIKNKLSFGKPSDEKLQLTSNIGNLLFTTGEIEELFIVRPGKTVDNLIKYPVVADFGDCLYKISETDDKDSLIIRDHLQKLIIQKNLGNIQGSIDGNYDLLSLKSDAGNIKVDLKGKINSFTSYLNMGNLDLNIYSLIPVVETKVDVGNITIHVAKGIRIETDFIKTKVGQIKIEQNGDGSLGSIELHAETNLGNITIIADL